VTIQASALAEYTLGMKPLCQLTLSASSAEPLSIAELLELADPEARRAWAELSLDYATLAGWPPLRDAIASLYRSVDREGVLCCAGAQEALFCIYHGLLDPGEHVIVVTPAYEALLAMPLALGADVTEVRLRHEEGWRLDPDQVREALRPDTRLLVVNFPHNPTGATIDAAELEQLLDLARGVGARVLSDEVFRLLDTSPLPPAADLYEGAVSLDVMSKAWGLGGVRIGWLATRDEEVLARARGVKGWTSICNGRPDEILALIAVSAREQILDRNRAIIRENLRILDGFFDRHAGTLEWVRPRAGCLAFPRLVQGDARHLAAQLARTQGTLLLPGQLFFGPPVHARLGFGRTDLARALERLEAVLQET
jgi:aspartate/methionine/tyrosine aminotransferase